MTLPPGLRVECWPQSQGWGVRLYWAGNKRARLDGLHLCAPSHAEGLARVAIERVIADPACPLVTNPRDTTGTPADRAARLRRRLHRFLCSDPLGCGAVEVEHPSEAVVRITADGGWSPKRARAVSAVLAERGIGIEIRAVGHAPRYVSVIHGLPRAVEWPADVVSKSFIATSVPPVPQVVTLETEAVA